MAYANRRFLQMVHETGKLGRVAMKPTQAMEDGINAGLLSWLLQGTQFNIGRQYAVDGYVEHRERVDRIIALLPDDFKAGMENWSGQMYDSSLSGSWKQSAFFSNPKVDELLQSARGATDKAKRQALYEEASKIVVEDAVDIWVYNTVQLRGLANRIDGYKFSPVGSGSDFRYLSIKQ